MKRSNVQQMIPRLLFLLMLLCCVALSVFFLWQGAQTVESAVSPAASILVIDPGHGGIDGGAVSDDGSKESDINLSISLKLRDIAELLGQQTVMTRSDDTIRTSYADYSEHEDLAARADLVTDTPGAVLISIHQNCYPTGQPSGSQVLYAATPGSEALGKRCHESLIRGLDPENRRVAEPAARNLYLTSHVNCTAILVECGFMSNNFEVQKLCRDDYQCSIALILAASYLQFLSESEFI